MTGPRTDQAPTPPHSVDAEQATIGAVIIAPDYLPQIMLILKPGDFYIHRHHKIWDAMKRLQQQRTPLDLMTLAHELEKSGDLDEVGGSAYLTLLTGRVEMTTNVEAYARIVEEHAIRRRMVHSGTQIVTAAFDQEATITDSLATAEKSFNSIMMSQANDRAHIKETLSDQYDQIERQEMPSTISSGYYEIDAILGGGFTGGRFYIWAGRPGEGKTSSLISFGYYAALAKKKVLLASMEMGRGECTDRLVSFHSGINTQRIEKRRMLEHEWPLYTQTVETLGELDIVFDDRPRQTPDHLRLTALHERPDMILVDYIQLMDGGLGPKANKNDQITEISRAMKLLARELDVPVIAACQLNRDVEKRRGREPQNSDLRESGALEQDADVIAFIWRNTTKVKVELEPVHSKIGKHRNGPTGPINGLFYRPECARIEQDAGQYHLPGLTDGGQ